MVGCDRSAALTAAEQNALEALGWELRRWPHRWRDRGQGDWSTLHRLILPLATAKDCLEVPEENDFQRRSAADAVALVLRGAYVGSRGDHLNLNISENVAVPGPGAVPPRQPYPNYGTISAWPACSASPS